MLIPSSIESESIVIRACFEGEKVLNRILEEVTIDMFYYRDNKLIYTAIKSLSLKTRILDDVLLLKELRSLNLINSQISNIICDIKDIYFNHNLDEHIALLSEKKSLRDLINIALGVEENIKKGSDSLSIISNIRECVLNIELAGKGTNNVSDKDLLYGNDEMMGYCERALKTYNDRIKNGDDYVPGFKSGYKLLDFKTGGFIKKHLTVIAARSGGGKSTFAFNIACNMAYKYKKKGLVFSLEMPKEECFAKVMSTLNKTSYDDIQKGRDAGVLHMNTDDIYNKMDGGMLLFDDTGEQTIRSLCSKIRREKEKTGIEFVIIDYLTRISPNEKKSMRYLEVGEISGSLKSIAKELDIAIICLAQLSRKTAERTDKSPQLSDLRESGDIEQDADLVLMLHRDEIYDIQNTSNIIKVHIVKSRHGKRGVVEMRSENDGSTLYEIDKSIQEEIREVYCAK